MIRFLKNLYLSEKGATAIEYGLIISLLAIAAIIAINGVGNTTQNMWIDSANEVKAVGNGLLS